MIKWFGRQTIRFNLLIIFLGLSIIPLIISIAQNYYFQKQTLVENASNRLEGITFGHSELVEKWFKDNLETVMTSSNEPLFQTNNPEKIKELLLLIKRSNPEFRNISYIDLKGNTIVNTCNRSTINVSDRSYFKTASSGKAVISDILISRFLNDPCIIFASPIKVNGKVTSVLAASVAVEDLYKIVDVSHEGKTFKSYLAGDNAYYIVPPEINRQTAKDQLISIDKDFLFLIKNNKPFGLYQSEQDNKKKIVAFRRMPEIHATLIVEQAESEAIEGIKGQGLKNNMLLTLVSICWIAPLAAWFSRRISRPLENISASLRMIAQGDFSQRILIPFANREVRVIAEDINLMGEQLQTFQATIEQQMIEMDEQRWEITRRNEELLRSQKIIKEQMDELEDIANRDQLTGIHNRRFFTAKLYQTIFSSIQNGEDLCVALLDIDYFKKVNDTYGHKVGDQVLKQLADLIQRTIRDADLVARFGGEEFIILAPNTRKDGGQVMAEKIRSMVENCHFKTDAGVLRLTVSIGVAFLSGCNLNTSIEQIEDCLFQVADKNLYFAKDLGRNKVSPAIIDWD